MRKLVVSMNITLDGYLSGPSGELDWHFNRWTCEMGDALCSELAGADTILLGRVTYAAMAAYWPTRLADPSCRGEDFAFANMMNTYRKIVFSSKLKLAQWNNSTLVTGNVEHQVKLLKKTPGKNIIVYGSAQLVNTLIQSGMVDKYQLWLHPVMVGNGTPLFRPGMLLPSACAQQLQLVKLQRFEGGVIRLDYQAAADKNTSAGRLQQKGDKSGKTNLNQVT
jgi:dihydrofolate reductase